MLLSSVSLLLVEQHFSAHSAQQIYKNIPALVVKYSTSPLRLNFKSIATNVRSFAFIFKGTLELNFSSLVDIAAVDYVKAKGRFGLNYLFFSSLTGARVIASFFLNETAPMPSLMMCMFSGSCLFPSVNWLEREVWDLFGIYFSEHQDLRRILTDYGFSGHPLRKDFPLTGFYELVYNDAEGRLISEPVELSQELRIFHI